MENFFAHNDITRKKMIEDISLASVEDLFSKIPQQARMQSIDLPEALSEMQLQRRVKAIAKKNNISKSCFIGAGIYNHFIPAAIEQVASRWEFLTAYTPYQPEISQGTLQIMYEYQSMICNLTGMDVSNACVYDGATACAEAVLMASRVTKKRKTLISNSLNPQYKTVIQTYCSANGIETEFIDYSQIASKIDTAQYASVLVQNPDFYGNINEFDFMDNLKTNKTLFIVCADISSLSILKPPSEYGADIVVGDIQSLGLAMSYGGPHAGYMSCKDTYMRQLPGRIVGKTLDAQGEQAFTLTIQTREQHIKREKATSNICSNQSLMALCATLYLSLIGEKGFRQVGILSAQYAHILAEKLKDKGIEILNKDFYNEFVIKVDDADLFLKKLDKKGIIGGLKLDENKILVALTETNTLEEIEKYVA